MLVWAPEQGSRELSGAAGQAPVRTADANPDWDAEALRERLGRHPVACLETHAAFSAGARTGFVDLSCAQQNDDVPALTHRRRSSTRASHLRAMVRIRAPGWL
jgi:hypothetical protein